MSQPSEKRLRMLEGHEVAAWGDFFRAAPEQVVELNGIAAHGIGSAVATIAARLDTLAYNRVVGLGLDGAVDDATIDNIVALFRSYGVPRFFVQLAPLPDNADLGRRLTDRGFRHYNNWVKLARGVEPVPAVNTDLRVEQIGKDQAEAFARVVVDSFEWSDRLVPWIASPVARDGWHHYMAYDIDQPVATAAMFVAGTNCWIDFAATLSRARGRGAQSALVARRITDCAAMGCDLMLVETAEPTDKNPAPSYRNMRRLGFDIAYTRPNYIWEE